MNEKQKFAFNMYKKGYSFFLTGAAGTGKSYVISEILKDLIVRFGVDEMGHNENPYFAITALTGISSLAIGGKTIHSWAGIGLAEHAPEILIARIKKNKSAYIRWRNCKVCIVDEISMMDIELFEKLHIIGCNLRQCYDKLWGGIQIIFAGDFLQLSPASGLDYCLFSPIWKQYVSLVVNLVENHRQKDNNQLQCILNNIRYGIISDEDKNVLNTRLITNLQHDYDQHGIKPTRLYSLKKNVNEININELNKLLSDTNTKRTFRPMYQLENNENFKNNHEHASRRLQLQRDVDHANNAKKILELVNNSYYNDVIYLCKNAQVMLTTNLDHELQLVNGQRGVIVDFATSGFPIVLFDNGIELIIPCFKFKVNNGPFDFIINQIPLTLAWAITIHKSQSLTISKVEVNLGSAFCHGQAYVSLSRVRDLPGLFISCIDYHKITADQRVVNFYKNVDNIDAC